MYVEWLLEFVWRIFIQGPLMLINFFTNSGNINKLLSNVGFISNKDWSVLNSFISLSIIIGFAAILFLMIFIFKIIKILIANNSYETKTLIINALKEFSKSIIIILVFAMVFNLVFVIFDVFARSMDKAYNGIENDLKTPIEKIPGYLYQFITHEPLNNKNFLFPVDLLTKMDSINWIFSILLVISFSWFLIWIVWSIFQKMIEIFFLYLSFPISVAFGMDSNQIHWKIWIKEIINKIALIFMLILFLRLYLYMFYFISEYAIIGDKRWTGNNSSNQLYIALFVTLGLGGAIMFMCRIFSYKNKEYIGLIGAINSFKQTSNFIHKNNFNNFNNLKMEPIKLDPINEHIDSLKNEISHLNYNQVDFENLKKVKVFDR